MASAPLSDFLLPNNQFILPLRAAMGPVTGQPVAPFDINSILGGKTPQQWLDENYNAPTGGRATAQYDSGSGNVSYTPAVDDSDFGDLIPMLALGGFAFGGPLLAGLGEAAGAGAGAAGLSGADIGAGLVPEFGSTAAYNAGIGLGGAGAAAGSAGMEDMNNLFGPSGDPGIFGGGGSVVDPSTLNVTGGAAGGGGDYNSFLQSIGIDPSSVSGGGGAGGGFFGGGGSGGFTPWQLLSGANAISGLIGAGAAKSAGQIQANAANNATAAQLGMFNTIFGAGAPYRAAGYSALSDLASNQPFFQHQFNASDLNANLAPNWQFALQQGQGAAANALNATGGMGGNYGRGLVDYTLAKSGDLYQQAFNNYTANQSNIFNRLSNIAGLGNQAYATGSGAGASISPGIANTTVGAGAAQAAGLVGSTNALTGGLQNAASWYALPSFLNPTHG